jgi:hypothetical protein
MTGDDDALWLERERELARQDPEHHVVVDAIPARGTGAAHGADTTLAKEVSGFGPKRLDGGMLGRGGPPSRRAERLDLLRAEVARRKRDGVTTALRGSHGVAQALIRDERQLADDVHRSGYPRWELFVADVRPED